MKKVLEMALLFLPLALAMMLKETKAQATKPEFVLEPPPKVFVSRAEGVTLQCAALGFPIPQIRWVDNGGMAISTIPGVRERMNNGTLWLGTSLPSADFKRSVYRCMASNTAGTIISRSTTVTILLPKDLSPRVESDPTRIGGVAVLRCRSGSSVEMAALETTWLMKRRGKGSLIQLPDAGRYIYGHSGTLYIQGTTQEDSFSRFACKVTPKATTTSYISNNQRNPHPSFPTSPDASIKIIREPNTNINPQIDTLHPLSIQVAEGTPFTMPCIAFSKSPPKYSWVRDEHSSSHAITSLSNAAGINMPSSSELWARGPILGSGRARVSHEGYYTCTVANAQGRDSAKYRLTVLQELKVSIPQKEQIVSAGDRAVIRCQVIGSPVSEVRWFKDGVSLQNHNHVSVQGREVILTGVNDRDVGIYQCVAANSLGEAQASSYLVIKESVPELKQKFIEQTLRKGPAVSLICSALGYPTPSITWMRDGRPLSQRGSHYSDSRITVGSWIDPNGHVVGQVNISSVSLLDGGLYECEASNLVGRTTHSKRLNVLGPPTARSPANLTAISKEDAVLPCPIVGYPFMEIHWMIDSRPLTPTPRRYAKSDGSVHIKKVDPLQDAKRFTCTVTNGEGLTASASFFLSVRSAPVLANFSFPQFLLEGMRHAVLCSLLEGDVPITLRWSREGGKALPNDGSVEQTHGDFYSNLVFKRVQGRHAGTYTCTASNIAASTSVSAVMNVKVPPQWVVEPEDVEVVAGEDLSLECHASGTPIPKVSWHRPKGDTSVAESPEVAIDGWRVTLPRRGTLKIRRTRPQDGGQYICHAQNGVSNPLSKIITIHVLEGARIEGRVANETVAVGGSLQLRCVASGHLPIVFTWSQNGFPVKQFTSSGLTLKVENEGKVSILELKQAERDHASVYTCQAANKFGADIKSFFVNVVENPDPPAHVHVVRVNSRQLTLAWAPPFDGNSPLTYYLIKHWAPDGQHYQKRFNTTVASDQTRATIQNLTPGTQYNVLVHAVNNLGVSSPSPTLSVTTSQEAPSSPPSQITATATRRGVISVSWQPLKGSFSSNHVTGYQVGYKAISSSKGYVWRSYRSSTLSAEIRGLKHYTPYEIVVRAINEVGSGPLSTPITATTAESEPSESPSMAKCQAIYQQSLKVSWNSIPPKKLNGPIKGYKVFFKKLTNIIGILLPAELLRAQWRTDMRPRRASAKEVKPPLLPLFIETGYEPPDQLPRNN